ncbi:MAG TPA: DUF4369 domain-containing protein [Flavobacterium sp.]|nr:DUF4369 domain-containing protein [Flavobacterium sp.]
MRTSILALCCLMIAAACSEKEKQGNLQISGNIKGLKKGTLYIQKLQDTALVAVDTIMLDGDSSFETAIDLESPEMLYLFLDRGVTNTIDNSLMFFAEPGKMTIDTDLETFYAKAKITGSKNHELYEEFNKVKSRFTNTDLDITEEVLTAYKEGKTAATAEKSAINMKRRYLYTINFALNNKNHEISPYVALSEIPDANIKYLDTIQRSMSKEVAASKYGKLLTEYVAERKKQQ